MPHPTRRALVAVAALFALSLTPEMAHAVVREVSLQAVPPDSTTLVSRPSGFGPLAAPVVNHSLTGSLDFGAQSLRVVSDAQNNRYVAFVSQSDGLSAEDDDRFDNVYVRDRLTARTILVSRATGAAGAGANSQSSDPAISPDGRFVAFSSSATNLTPDSVSGQETHVFVRDLVANSTLLIDRANGSNGAVANDASWSPSVTTDGAQPVVAFTSSATNLGATTGGFLQIYVRRVVSDTTTLVSAADNSASAHGTGSSTQPALSGDGTRVAFSSAATNLTAFVDNNTSSDVFVRNLATNDTIFVSQANAGIGDDDSFAPSISEDGTKVAFSSAATNFSIDDGNATQDVFAWDDALPDANDIVLVSRASGSGAAGNQDSGEPSISGAGDWVAFTSGATNLIADDTNASADVFLRTGVFGSGQTSRQSRGGPPTTFQYDEASASPSLALDAGYLAFSTFATNAGDSDDDDFVQVYGRPLGLTLAGPAHLSRPDGADPFRSGVNASSLRPRTRSEEAVDSMSADGRYTVFLSDEDDLVADDVDAFTNVYRRDNLTGETILVSRADGAAGAAADGPSAGSGSGVSAGVPAPSGAPGISADGNRIVFASSAANLVPGDTNGLPDVFVRDVAAGQTLRASVRPDGSQIPALPSGDPAISGDGLRVAFVTREAMSPGVDTNTHGDVYLRDLAVGTTTLASREALAGDQPSGEPALDADGSRVAFTSGADNLAGGGANSPDSDVFVRDVGAGQTFLASRRSGAAGVIGDGSSFAPSLSDDGQRVAFASLSTNLALSGDVNGSTMDVFVRDLQTGQTLLASRSDGANGVSPNGASRRPSISADGTRVVFETAAPDLVAGDQNGFSDVALRDLTANTTVLVSRAAGAAGILGNAGSGDPALSGNGDCVAFSTRADNLVAQPAGVDFDRVVARSLRGECPFGPVASPPPAPGPPPPTTPDTTPPTVSNLRAVPARFRAGTRVTPPKKGRPAVGTRFTFGLSEAGRVTITISRALPGKRVNSRCVRPRPGLDGRACVRLVRRGAIGADGVLGPNRVRFAGKLRGRLLAPGRYQARVVVRDAAGNASQPRRVRFVVLPRRS